LNTQAKIHFSLHALLFGSINSLQRQGVILAVGFDPTTESEGEDRTFNLPIGQDELVREIMRRTRTQSLF
jgi:hypothetical protein